MGIFVHTMHLQIVYYAKGGKWEDNSLARLVEPHGFKGVSRQVIRMSILYLELNVEIQIMKMKSVVAKRSLIGLKLRSIFLISWISNDGKITSMSASTDINIENIPPISFQGFCKFYDLRQFSH